MRQSPVFFRWVRTTVCSSMELMDKTQSEISNADESVYGDIYIGSGETDAMRLIAKLAKKLQASYPHIQYHLYSGNAEDVIERLDKGLLDFGVMKKDSPLAALDNIRPENLQGIPLLCSRQALAGNELSGWLRESSEKLNIAATYNLIYNATLMVEEGVGYALCLDKLVNTTSSSGLCFKPLEPRLEAHLNIVWKKYQVFSKAAEKFLKELQEAVSADA